ncbi:thioredoxin family protein [unidentified eubacterium SCB49]|nr:thioredoxin family protein [unidentified eubacterium SCB49]
MSCADNSTTYTLQGTTVGYPDGARVYVYSLDANNQPKVIDTLIIQDASFSGTYPKTDALGMNYLKPDYTKKMLFYFPENTNLKAVIYKDSIDASSITGSPQNDNFNQFQKDLSAIAAMRRERTTEFNKARMANDRDKMIQIQQQNRGDAGREKEVKLSFIEENPNALYSAMLISEMFTKGDITADKALASVNNLSPKVSKSTQATKIKAAVNAVAKSSIGGDAPKFSAPTPEGETLSLDDALGKYTIIDFWASWCRPCRMENPNVVSVYNKYHDKGLNIISVSLDRKGQRERWIKAIEDDNMDWYHVSNLQFWNDPIAKQYNVRSIPATFLLDENGKIIAKNLRGPALGAKIAKLLD